MAFEVRDEGVEEVAMVPWEVVVEIHLCIILFFVQL